MTATAESAVAARYRAARAASDLVVLEGFHALKHAVRFGAEIVDAICANRAELEELATRLADDIVIWTRRHVTEVVPEALAAAAPRAPHTGVLAIAHRRRVDVSAVLADAAPRPIVLLEEPRALGNVGAAIRVAAAADAAGVLTTGLQDPWHADAVRGAAGLQFALPVARVEHLPVSDRPLLAVDPDGEPLMPAQLPPRALLAFGTERHGLTEALLERADLRVRIPMREGVSSLNLATSVAAVLYAWRLR